MPRSVVDLAKLNELDATIRSFDSNTGASMAAYYHSARNLLSQFDAKLNELSITLQRASEALRRCNSIQDSNPMKSCASEEAAFNRAYRRYKECEELVKKARQAIFEYSNYAAEFRKSKNDLCSRASAGLKHVESFVTDYNDNATPSTDNVMSNGVPVVSPSTTPLISSTEEQNNGQTMGDTFRFITGGDQIDHVNTKGFSSDSVAIDMESYNLEGLPPVTAPDKSQISKAAVGILGTLATILAAGGLILGKREMLLREKTDEIFKSKYGITGKELRWATGSKQKEYVEAYNDIYKSLQQEMKKKEIDEKLTKLEHSIDCLKNKNAFSSVRNLARLEVDKQNLENERATLEDGKIRPHVPYDKTYVAGLTEKEMLYMMGDNKMSAGRFANALIALNKSEGYEFKYEHEAYGFEDGETMLRISHDGSKITERKVSDVHGFSYGAQVGLGEAGIFDGNSFDAKTSEVSREHSAKAEFSPSISGNVSYGDVFNIRADGAWVSEDGSAFSARYDIKLGNEAYAEGSLGTKGLNASGGLSIGKTDVGGALLSRPMIVGNYIVQVGAGGQFGLNAGGEIDYNFGVGEKGAKAKAGIAALLKASAEGRLDILPIDKLPASVAKNLSESLPTWKQAVSDASSETITQMAKNDMSFRFGSNNKI